MQKFRPEMMVACIRGWWLIWKKSIDSGAVKESRGKTLYWLTHGGEVREKKVSKTVPKFPL